MVNSPAFPHHHHQGELSNPSLVSSSRQAVRGGVSSPGLTPSGLAHSYSPYQGQLSWLAQASAGPVLPSAASGEAQDQLSHTPDFRDNSPTCYRQLGVEAEGICPLPSLPYDRRMGQDLPRMFMGTTHLCPCQQVVSTGLSGEVQVPLSQVLQQLRDKINSPTLMTSGPAFPPAVGGEGQGTNPSLAHATM